MGSNPKRESRSGLCRRARVRQDGVKELGPIEDLLSRLNNGGFTARRYTVNAALGEPGAKYSIVEQSFDDSPRRRHLHPERQSELETDASGQGLTSILTQLDEETGLWHPVACWSRKTENPEKKRILHESVQNPADCHWNIAWNRSFDIAFHASISHLASDLSGSIMIPSFNEERKSSSFIGLCLSQDLSWCRNSAKLLDFIDLLSKQIDRIDRR